ncbi:Glyoxylate/hydroxypyruvate reductase B [Caprobacter fermentans]|uniref:Glyoxylate/hydroxypyruvate reductase B n=1 Tax=Caproicibacter fermentans TaxID=2576756 RepID=A0A6N8HYE7_9FIRM|nr:2-hydroxyacid dehydrogenase [Caproicibacter fermentans]MVB10698.1 Glyoxylate/hydroxypyruvate reductase B [Caproicibacter fermentans]OCN00562.1 hypothetical protein A7X67_16505 [Clostridium sp. W14A]
MLDFLKSEPQNIVVVGDAFVRPETMERAVRASRVNAAEVSRVFWGNEDKDDFAARQMNLEKNGPEAEPWAEGLAPLLKDCTVLMTHFSPVPRGLIDRAPKLRAVLTCRGGMEHIDVKAAGERKIPVINVIRNAVPVAEFALGLMLAMTRNIASSHHRLMEGEWLKEFPNSGFVSTLGSLTVGLVGLGNVGMELAIRLKALEVPLIVQDDYLDRDRMKRNGLGDVTIVETKEDVFRLADLVSLHLRLTPETRGIIDQSCFSLMKPSSYLINTARGGIVNQADLIDALRRHAIAGAALDVFDREPLTPEDGFAGLDNVVITPHIAGATVDAIPNSPFLLMRTVDKILTQGLKDRIVNYKEIFSD